MNRTTLAKFKTRKRNTSQPVQSDSSKILCSEGMTVSLGKQHLSKKGFQKIDLLRAIKILFHLPVAFPAVLKLMKLLATLPVTTASNERFFSALGRVKVYLQSTMENDRYSDLMVMAVGKKEVKKRDLDRLVNDFVQAAKSPLPPVLCTFPQCFFCDIFIKKIEKNSPSPLFRLRP